MDLLLTLILAVALLPIIAFPQIAIFYFVTEAGSWAWSRLRGRPYRPAAEAGWWPCFGACALVTLAALVALCALAASAGA